MSSSLNLNNIFVVGLAKAENSVRAGWNKEKARWFPHRSLEGGTDTIAYGHKLTQEEVAKDHIKIGPLDVNLDDGLTEMHAVNLLKQDIQHHEMIARKQWDRSYGNVRKFDDLPEKYRGILVDITFNTGRLEGPGGTFIWKNLAGAILENNDFNVLRFSIVSWKDAVGIRRFLLSRRKSIAISLGFNAEMVGKIQPPQLAKI